MDTAKAPKVRIGDLLVSKGLIVEDQLKAALTEQKRTGKKIGKVVVDLGFVTEAQMLQTMANHFGYPFVDLLRFRLNNDLIKALPETYARRFRAILLAEQPDGLLVGMSDPLDLLAIDELQRILKRSVHPAFVKEQDLLAAMDRSYRRSEQIASIAVELDSELETTDFDLENLATTTDTAEAPVVRLLQSIFEDAVQVRASDIHIEPDEQVLRVRLRIDGELQEQVMKERRIAPALVSRLKIMSGLDISEKRLPQDGRFNVRILGKSIDVRLSTLPVPYGECVVMRLLDQSAGMLSMDKLGMPESIRNRFENLIQRPYGMVLVTGPTGSGKTTTLYGTLDEINDNRRNIITLEDPIEYQLPGVSQTQINEKKGLTFASGLRNVLRQDPDIIMVGEIRDHETAVMAIQSALTGHLVFSTLHTNDASSAVTRLLDLGIEPYLVGSSVAGVMAQRLVRKVCSKCVSKIAATPAQIQSVQLTRGDVPEDLELCQIAGCEHCRQTGYRGRVGLFELLQVNEAIRQDITQRATAARIKQTGIRHGMQTLRDDGVQKIINGLTTLEEVDRVTVRLEGTENFVDETV